MINKRLLGDKLEKECVLYLQEHGIADIETNFRCKLGEIDIIGTDGKYLVFFEVKYRSSTVSGYAEDAVGYTKQKTISRVADYYICQHRASTDMFYRFDVLAVNDNKLNWIKNAFDYIPK